MFYSEPEKDCVILIWQYFSTHQIHQIQMIANICRSTVDCKIDYCIVLFFIHNDNFFGGDFFAVDKKFMDFFYNSLHLMITRIVLLDHQSNFNCL
jgi:hypothetical protein